MVAKIAVLVIVIFLVAVPAGYFGYTMHLNQWLTDANLEYFKSYANVMRNSGVVGAVVGNASQTVCDFDLSDPDLTCINMTTGDQITCEDLNSDVGMKGLSLSDCDKNKIDSKFDDIGNYDHNEQSFYISISSGYAYSVIFEEFLSFIEKNYETDTFYANKFGDIMAALHMIASGGNARDEIIIPVSSCSIYEKEYGDEEKASRCIAEMVVAFDSVSDELEKDTSFDDEWTELCTRNLLSTQDASFEWQKQVSVLTTEHQLCQRMAVVFNTIMSNIDENEQNVAERLYTSAVFYIISNAPIKKPSYNYEPVTKKIAEKMGSEFIEAKNKIMEL